MDLNINIPKKGNEAFVKFINKYKLTNDTSIDELVKFYLDNRNIINFNDIHDTHDYISCLEKIPKSKELFAFEVESMDFTSKYSSRSKLAQKLNINVDERFGSFVNVTCGDCHKYYDIPDDLTIKIWLNIDYKHQVKIAEKIIKYLYCKNRNRPILFKYATEYQRNDMMTFYTDYNNAPELIDFILKLSKKKPEWFQKVSKDNPFILKINDFITFADCSGSYSFPKEICELLAYVETNATDLNKYEQKETYIKSLILKGMSTRNGLCNPKHIALFRDNNYHRIEALNMEERDEYIKTLSEQADELLKQLTPIPATTRKK